MAQHDLPLHARPPHTYTLLTIGDGLVSQIPALIISIAAGLLVSKAGVEGSADKALFGQLAAIPRRSGCRRPAVRRWRCCPACRSCRSGAGRGDRSAPITCRSMRERSRRNGRERWRTRRPPPVADEPIATALAHRRAPARAGLRPAAADQRRRRAAASPTRSRRLRRQLAGEFGFVMPSVRIQDNMQLPPNTLRHPDQGDRGRPRRAPAHMLLVMDPRGEAIAARRAHDGADLRPARHLDRRRPTARKRCSAATPWSIRPPC